MNTPNMSEEDMGFVTEIFQKIANALVMSTEFPKQISDMKADLVSLHTDLETTKGRNAELDALLHDTRRQRDEAEQALSQAKLDVTAANNGLAIAKSQADNFEHDLSITKAELVSVRKERDDYGLQAMAAEDRAKAAEAKLAKLAEALGLPKAEAKPEPSPVTIPHGDPVPELSKAEPTPLKRIYLKDNNPAYDYKHEKWDNDKQDWYCEDLPF